MCVVERGKILWRNKFESSLFKSTSRKSDKVMGNVFNRICQLPHPVPRHCVMMYTRLQVFCGILIKTFVINFANWPTDYSEEALQQMGTRNARGVCAVNPLQEFSPHWH